MQELYKDSHMKYVLDLEKSKDLDSIGFYLTEHLRVSGCYWSIGSLYALKHNLSKGLLMIIKKHKRN